MGFRNAGAKAGAPCSPAVSQSFPDLQATSLAASAECERPGRPWHAARPHESCACSSETALREKLGEEQAGEMPALWRSGRASWPAPSGSPRGFRERSRHVPVERFSRHTSLVFFQGARGSCLSPRILESHLSSSRPRGDPNSKHQSQARLGHISNNWRYCELSTPTLSVPR